MAWLSITGGKGPSRRLHLREGLCVGREDACDLVLDDTKVSRQHLRFAVSDGGWTVIDLGSKHGTFVNGRRPPKASVHVLADGDVIQVGDTLLVFEAHEETSQVVREVSRREAPVLLGESAAMVELRARIRKVAAADAHVVIHGETGTGKELVARETHRLSRRAEQPFVAVNCAALPEGLVESELFGHKRGTFPGALDRTGSFVLADRGTLFLDEIGELALAAQAKVLRAIQEGEVQPLGDHRVTRVDVRILAASHKDLSQEVKGGRFREDLYYRLHVVEVTVPTLREREGDVALLARAFLTRSALKLARPIVGFSKEAMEALTAHAWPGNVRELQNEVERAIILAEGPLVEIWDLSAPVRTAPPFAPVPDSREPPDGQTSLAEQFDLLGKTERALVKKALLAENGNIAAAARRLGISRIMLSRRKERFRL